MKSKSANISIMIVSIILGLVLASQFKNVQKVGGNVSLQRTQELSSKVEKLNSDNEALRDNITQMQDKLRQYESASKSNGTITNAMLDELNNARIQAGLIDVQGSGVQVTVNSLYYVDSNNNKQVMKSILDQDLLSIVNELNASGAEAISVNGERLIATSEIRNAGDYININTNSYSAPIIIKAIGNPQTLEAGLNLNGGVIDSIKGEYDIKIAKVDNMTVPKYKGVIKFNYAKPVKSTK